MALNRCILIIGLSTVFALFIISSVYGAPSETLAKIIEGAKKEGTLTAKLRSGFTPKSMKILEKKINEKFGVSLDIKFVPGSKMTKNLAEAIMEHKAGAVPSYDLMTFSHHVVQGMKAGIFERVDWKPIITNNTNSGVIHEDNLTRGAIIYYTGHLGLMYNPEKILSEEVPKTLSDLADPKWKGKMGIIRSSGAWSRWAFVLGKDDVLSTIRHILQNNPIQGRYSDLNNRFLIGEIAMCMISSVYLKGTQDKGIPAAWQSLNFSDIGEFSLVVRKGAKHPNAARLVAAYLASPEGAEFTLNEAGSGNLYYPGNYEHDIRLKDKAQNMREVFNCRDKDILEFYYSSGEYKKWGKEIKLILETGGQKGKKKKKKST